MNRFEPGSLAWLLGYELKLAWRGGPKGKGRWVAMIVVLLLMLVGGVPIGLMLAHRSLALTPMLIAIVDGVVLAVFTLMANTALGMATLVFFERGDLDLFLASPVSGRRVLAVRTAAIAVSAAGGPVILLTPFLLPIILLGHWPWLAIYPVLAALALLAAAAGIALSMILFRLSGPRTAKVVGQIVASVTGAAIFLASQMFRMVPGLGKTAMRRLAEAQRQGWFASISPLAWPAEAASGHLLPLTGLILVCAAVFAAVAWRFGRRFVDFAALAAGVASGPAKVSRRDHRFARSARSAIGRKEWRLILRDPSLISQMLVRLLYLLPICAVVFTRAGASAAAAVGPLVLMAGQIAGSLAWIALSAEDCPDLLASSPLPAGAVRRTKLIAALQPTAVLLLIPAAGLAVWSPLAGGALLVGGTAAMVTSGSVNLWLCKPAQRTAFARRTSSSITASIAEIGLVLGWSFSAGLAAAGSMWALVPAVLTLLGLGGVKVLAEPAAAMAQPAVSNTQSNNTSAPRA